MGADAELLHPTMSREEAYARPCHTRAEGECGCFVDDGRAAWMCEEHREAARERQRAAEGAPTPVPVLADADTLNQWTPAPALTDEWTLLSDPTDLMQRSRWRSRCGRVRAEVWYNTHGKDWRWMVDSPAQATQTVGNPAPSCAEARALALDTARRIAELDAAPPSSKWHPIAAGIASTVAEKNAAYGDSVTRSADIMRVLYPDGIPVAAYGDALLIVRVLDKLSRIATDRDALGESPWRDIAGYALRACEGAGK